MAQVPSWVSILTQPVGRVQLGHRRLRTVARTVSILTRPVGRVQLGAAGPLLIPAAIRPTAVT